MNSRGEVDDATMFIVFIFLNAIVVGGILMAMGAFYSNQYDGRAIEAQALAESLQNCVMGNNVFVANFNISSCGLNERVLSEDHLVYVSDGEHEFALGVVDYKNQCYFNAGENKAYPVCAKKTFVKDGKTYTLIAGSNQKIRGLNT